MCISNKFLDGPGAAGLENQGDNMTQNDEVTSGTQAKPERMLVGDTWVSFCFSNPVLRLLYAVSRSPLDLASPVDT